MCSRKVRSQRRQAKRFFPATRPKADARTRTGDPFITSDGPLSASVRSGHSRPLSKGGSVAWSGLEVTGEDNLVDGWWTPEMLSDDITDARDALSGDVGQTREPQPGEQGASFSAVTRLPLHSLVFAAAFEGLDGLLAPGRRTGERRRGPSMS